MTANRTLGEGRHRVAITSWPITQDPDNGLTDAESLFEWARVGAGLALCGRYSNYTSGRGY
jgi:hypothetical protein